MALCHTVWLYFNHLSKNNHGPPREPPFPDCPEIIRSHRRVWFALIHWQLVGSPLLIWWQTGLPSHVPIISQENNENGL